MCFQQFPQFSGTVMMSVTVGADVMVVTVTVLYRVSMCRAVVGMGKCVSVVLCKSISRRNCVDNSIFVFHLLLLSNDIFNPCNNKHDPIECKTYAHCSADFNIQLPCY